MQEQPGYIPSSHHILLPDNDGKYSGNDSVLYLYQSVPWKAIHDPFRLFPFVPGLLLSPHLSEEAHLQNVLRLYYKELRLLHGQILKSEIFAPVLKNTKLSGGSGHNPDAPDGFHAFQKYPVHPLSDVGNW